MKALEAAYEVLRDAAEPLDKHELVRRMLARGLWSTAGKTPWETVRKDIQVDIRKHGAASRFRQVAPGVFTLSDRPTAPPPVPQTARAGAGDAAATTRAAGSMSFLDAAEQVLRDSGAREPLHYEEIARRAIESGHIQPEGKTPATSLNSMVGTDIRRREARGESPKFTRHGRGLIGLASWAPSGLAVEVDEHNRGVRETLLKQARKGKPADFERLVATLLVEMGFDDVTVTSLGGDGGIDVRGTLVVGNVVRVRMAVQAKRWKNNVTAPVVQQVRGSLGVHEQGLIITTSDFSPGAVKEAGRSDTSPVALMNGEQLAALLAEHQVGVKREPLTLLQLLDSDDPS